MITRDDALVMDVQQGGRCFLCGHPMSASASTFEHLIPRALGGADETGNVVLAHRRCNLRKLDDLPSIDAVLRLVEMRRGSRLGVWPPLLAILDADPEFVDLAVAEAIAEEYPTKFGTSL